jgi:exodeoxyribonuclease V alpha subunit
MQENSALLQFIAYTQQITFSNLDYKELFAKFTQQSTLCLANSGVLGSENINQQIERQIKLKLAIADEWYSGRPIIVLQNDYTLELFNGDIGVCVVENGESRIVFENGKQLIPELLPRYALAYAITIHKSQGSEYDLVNVLIPNVSNDSNLAQLLSRSLLYTGVTRAKHNVQIFASAESLRFAIGNNNLRISGLSQMMNSESLD